MDLTPPALPSEAFDLNTSLFDAVATFSPVPAPVSPAAVEPLDSLSLDALMDEFSKAVPAAPIVSLFDVPAHAAPTNNDNVFELLSADLACGALPRLEVPAERESWEIHDEVSVAAAATDPEPTVVETIVLETIAEDDLAASEDAKTVAGTTAVEEVEGSDTVVLTDTQVARAISTPAYEAPEDNFKGFAIQLRWSKLRLHASDVRQDGIIKEYQVYEFNGRHNNERGYGVRLGFFSQPCYAEQVVHFLRAEYPNAEVVRATDREMARVKRIAEEAAEAGKSTTARA
jgi:hypothetical protein